ncbi:coatamer subunit protein [Apiospora rasikravindrae]|uniref:Coatamer subunit protein n=1 Tax=Apiospora rasikravindrae TaxID=990691 RepID=A0ABR1SK38_9PEZI
MSASKKLDDFPDVEAKLQKAHKQSAFEKEKAEREAKRKREAAETAAVYESFVKSFDHDNDDDEDDEISALARGTGPGRGSRGGGFAAGGGALGRRHFGAAGNAGTPLKSGPGSLGPPPGSYGRKRGFDGGFQRDFGRHSDDGRGRLGFHGEEREREKDRDRSYDAPGKGISKAFGTGSDDEADGRTVDRAEERAVAKPTLRLANLPPGTSPAVIKALIPPSLTVENVKILPQAAPVANERKSMAAIVILSQETPATDMDSAVSSLQNRYLGYGFYLSLHRHLSSAVATTNIAPSSSLLTTTSSTSSQPFGAKPAPQPANDPPHSHQFHRGFAPPPSYGPGGGAMNRSNLLHVPVQAPRDIKQLQLIHKTIESVLEHGPEFEALLMSRPDVQREERWAWLWDARSTGGVWYRWRLWEVITGSQTYSNNRGGGKPTGKYLPLFESSHAWKAPDKPLVYEYTTRIDEFVSDPEYNSSDDDYEDEGTNNRMGDFGAGAGAGDEGTTYLNPLDKAKLVHLLARLPTTLSRIRKGDIARITTFAITHASRGADEIVNLIVSNVQKPLALTSANPDFKQQQLNAKSDIDDGAAPAVIDESADTNTTKPTTNNSEQVDTSGASLVALYVVSDILSSSATSGVRHSWRFRQLFETALRGRRIFEHLGLMAERLGWGRLRSDKWKRSVGLILSLWEGWCVFPAEAQELFTKGFESPPSLSKKDGEDGKNGAAAVATEAGVRIGAGDRKTAGKWKPVEAGVSNTEGFKPVSLDAEKGVYDPAGGSMDLDDLDGEVAEDDDEGALMDSDIDGLPMTDDEVDDSGEPMVDVQPTPPPTTASRPVETAEKDQPPPKPELTGVPIGPLTTGDRQPRRRLRAVDMFADSDASDS